MSTTDDEGTIPGTPVDAGPVPRTAGRVRIDERARRLASRLEPGDVAVIDHPDLDRATAQALAQARPAAVLNAQPSTSGRYPNLGPRVLLDAGVLVVDDLGPDVLTLREGQRIEVVGATVRAGGRDVATGTLVTPEVEAAAMEAARQGVAARVEAFAASTGEYLVREADLLLGDSGLPDTGVDLTDRAVVLVLPGPRAAAQLRDLRAWMREADPVLVGVGAGADVLLAAHRRPALIVGDLDDVSEKALTCGASLVLRAGHDGGAPGRERVDRRGLTHTEVLLAGTDEDAAILLADLGGARVIVRVGAHDSVQDFLDRDRSGMASSFFTGLHAGDRLVSAPAVLATHRPGIGAGWLTLLLVVALAAMGVALWSTPWGHDLWNALVAWVQGLVGGSPAAGTAKA